MTATTKVWSTNQQATINLDGVSIGNNLAAPSVNATAINSGNMTATSIGQSISLQAYHTSNVANNPTNINVSAATITGGSVEAFLDVIGVINANCTLTLPSVTAVVTAMAAAGLVPVAGMTWKLSIFNDQSGAFSFTTTADTGATWTLSGTAQTIAKGTKREYLVTLTSLIAGTMQSLGEITVAAAP